jgi:hypothetical protein
VHFKGFAFIEIGFYFSGSDQCGKCAKLSGCFHNKFELKRINFHVPAAGNDPGNSFLPVDIFGITNVASYDTGLRLPLRFQLLICFQSHLRKISCLWQDNVSSLYVKERYKPSAYSFLSAAGK